MKHFKVSAIKYRPQAFEDVVGQSAITNTLENAIKNNHLPQALLFTGPRGVGKTTCARILAKKINQLTDEDKDLERCFAFNIFELDAASNNSVDDIRNLIDQVRFAPQQGKYKVYIIDEVHMLSKSAFNAFLKTLEEPPVHAVFILATTEKQKIIPTILSRCQIYDFKRVTIEDIKNHLHRIANDQGVRAEDDALQMIAQKADGALRDSLSLFDRVVSFCGKNLTRQAVSENLNILDYDYYFRMVDCFVEHNISKALLEYNHILERGFDGHDFVAGLLSHLRDLLVVKDRETIGLLEVGEKVKQKYIKQSTIIELSHLIRFINILNDCDIHYKNSRNKRLWVEIALMRLACVASSSQEDKKKIDKILSPANEQNNIQNNSIPKQAQNTDEIEKSKKVLKSSRNRISGLSIKSFTTEKKSVKVSSEGDLPKDNFTQEQLLKVWKKYLEVLQNSKSKVGLASFLSKVIPKLSDDQIIVKVHSNTLQKMVEELLPQMLVFFKEQLNNHYITFKIEVCELENKTSYIYTSEEKLAFLIKKNPKILDFTRVLNLRLA